MLKIKNVYNRVQQNIFAIKLTGNATKRKRCPILSNMWLVDHRSLHCLCLGRMRQSCWKLPLVFEVLYFLQQIILVVQELVGYWSPSVVNILVSAMKQRKDISSSAWISANGNTLLIYRRKFVAPVSVRYSVVKTGHSNVHQQSGSMFCKTAIQETPWRKNWLLKTMAETENRGKSLRQRLVSGIIWR